MPTTPTASDAHSYNPADLVRAVADFLRSIGFAVSDEPDAHMAYLGAATLLRALDIELFIHDDDHSAGAEAARVIMLEDSVKTTTRSRRSV